MLYGLFLELERETVQMGNTSALVCEQPVGPVSTDLPQGPSIWLIQHLGNVPFLVGKRGGVALLCSPQLHCSIFQKSGLQEMQWPGGIGTPTYHQVFVHTWKCSLCSFIILMSQEPKRKDASISSFPPRMTQAVFFSVFVCFLPAWVPT